MAKLNELMSIAILSDSHLVVVTFVLFCSVWFHAGILKTITQAQVLAFREHTDRCNSNRLVHELWTIYLIFSLHHLWLNLCHFQI